MCISLTEADAIHILMQSQRYNTLKIHMKQIAIWDYTKLKLNFNCYKKHTLTHLSLVVMPVLDYILFTHYNSPFTVTAIIKCKFDSELLCSICLASILAASHPKWIYLHDFLTFTDKKNTCDMSVMHWGKQNVSNALNSTNIFTVCLWWINLIHDRH